MSDKRKYRPQVHAQAERSISCSRRFAAIARWPSEQRRRIAELERALAKKTYEREISGKLLRDWE